MLVPAPHPNAETGTPGTSASPEGTDPEQEAEAERAAELAAKEAAEKEKAQSFFEIRLWDANDLIQALLANYERLPDDIQAEIPLKRIWILLPGEEEG